MKYIALCDSYGVAGGYVKQGETVTITDRQKKACDSEYFDVLFAPVDQEPHQEENDGDVGGE
ncbi:hypothetical protein [Veillonella montpellierensis]|uniref:hypothetical protein n=1 Tax=Veillonella montpellierensis TaxID=187328 RepID=UPI0023F99D6A|nr:hypothetical protein [Veillonella montpellierensis]